MSACAGAAGDMVLDAAGSSGPFQPLALVHFRGEVCVCQRGVEPNLLIEQLHFPHQTAG